MVERDRGRVFVEGYGMEEMGWRDERAKAPKHTHHTHTQIERRSCEGQSEETRRGRERGICERPQELWIHESRLEQRKESVVKEMVDWVQSKERRTDRSALPRHFVADGEGTDISLHITSWSRTESEILLAQDTRRLGVPQGYGGR